MMADDEASADDAGGTGASPPADAHPQPAAGTGDAPADINGYIGSRLRQVFDDIASQPIPDRFLQLMQDLDKR